MKINYFLKFSAVFFCYFLTARLGLKMDAVSGFASLVWPPTGIALSVILLYGFRFWPAIFFGAFFVNLSIGAPFVAAGGIAIGNTLEALLGAYLLLNFTGFRCSLERIRDVISLIIFASFLSTLVSATIGVTSLLLGHVKIEGFGPTWTAWWVGDMLGDLVVAPLLLVLGTQLRRRNLLKFNFWHLLEGLFLSFSLLVVGLILFSSYPARLGIPSPTLPYILFPLIVWASLRFDQMGNTLVIFVTSCLAIWGTSKGFGPFSNGNLRENLFLLHSFIGVIALTGLTLAASVTERKSAIEKQKKAEGNEKFLIKASDILTGSLDYDTRLLSLARLTIPILADWCLVDVVDENGELKRVATAHNDPAKEDLLHELQKSFPPNKESPQPSGRVLRNGKNELLNNMTDEVIRAHCFNERHASLMKKIGIRSHLAVPLIFQNKITGVLTLGRITRHSFGADDVVLIERLAKRAALSIDNAKLYRDVQRAVQLRDDFLSIASHELRTPLTSLYLELQLIDRMIEKSQTSPVPKEKLKERIDLSQKQTKHLSNLIDSLLDVSRLGTGTLTIKREILDISAIINDVIACFREEAKYSGCEFMVHGNNEIIGFFDKVRITQAITNLVSNAIKYGRGKPVEVFLKAEGAKVRVVIKDQGVGIPLKDQERIFGRFERAISFQNISGMGLGLFIAREIAVAHGGVIRLESEINKGATFILELPLNTGPLNFKRESALETKVEETDK